MEKIAESLSEMQTVFAYSKKKKKQLISLKGSTELLNRS